jgi:predicted ATPase/class 3 adenylate cyclase
MDHHPSGSVTFLFTDIEGSTRYWEQAPAEMPGVYARHDEIVRTAVSEHQGAIYKVVGDAFQIAFPSAKSAFDAAIAAQRALLAESWPVSPPPRVRMALHLIDIAPEPSGDYRAPGLNRLGRLLAAADGGQILLTEPAARELLETSDHRHIRDLGEHHFRDLSPQRVYQVVADGLPSQRAAPRGLTPHRHNLPIPATSFVGRLGELRRLEAAILERNRRVLTLVGPGGIGKTRLAIEFASRLIDYFADGVWFVSLAAVADPNHVIPEIASVLGIRESIAESTFEALVAHLTGRETLLLLDNLEQVIEVAPQIAHLVASCPKLSLLVTSRAPLRIAGEQEFPVRPLAVSATGSHAPVERGLEAAMDEAVQLFAERLRAIDPEFQITSENAAAVAAICQRLDGLPLAIELAAARGRLLPPAKLLDRLDARLPLLTGGPRDAPARQQTLRAAIDWSFDLLTPAEQLLFQQLAVFTGGASLEAIECVCGKEEMAGLGGHFLLDTLESLARQSLLSQDGAAGLGRVVMLETIREFAQERLRVSGLAREIASRHATYFCRFADDAEPELSGPHQSDWLDALGLEHDNLRVALSYFEASGQATELARMAGALWRFWWIRGHLSEGRDWLRRAVAAGEDSIPAALRGRVLDGAGALAEAQGDIESATHFHERAIALWQAANDRLGQARALENLGIIALHDRGEVARARELHERALTFYRAIGDRQGIGSSLKNLGDVALAEEAFANARKLYGQALVISRELSDTRGIAAGLTSLGVLAFLDGESTHAISLYEESLPLWRALDDVPGLALVLGNLGEALDHAGDSRRARLHYEESLRLSQELGDQQGIAFSRTHLARIARQDNDLTDAARLYAEAAELCRDIGDFPRLAEAIEGLAGTLLDSGEPTTAARLFGMAATVRESKDAPLHSIHAAAHEHDVVAVRSLLGPKGFESLFAAGALTGLNELALGAVALGPRSQADVTR